VHLHIHLCLVKPDQGHLYPSSFFIPRLLFIRANPHSTKSSRTKPDKGLHRSTMLRLSSRTAARFVWSLLSSSTMLIVSRARNQWRLSRDVFMLVKQKNSVGIINRLLTTTNG
jgi:hypothetical protein